MNYSYLNIYTERVRALADECVNLALEDKNDCSHMVIIEDLLRQFGLNSIDINLLEEILAEREELENVEITDGKIFLTCNKKFKKRDVEDEYLEMKIPGGKIIVERGADKEYNDIFIYYRSDKDEDDEFDLATISANDKEKIKMYLYGKKDTDSPSMEIGWKI